MTPNARAISTMPDTLSSHGNERENLNPQRLLAVKHSFFAQLYLDA